MKKLFIYALTALLGFGAVSCSDDNEDMRPVDPTKDFNRMPMTQFRHLETTNKDETADQSYCSMPITEERNTIRLA